MTPEITPSLPEQTKELGETLLGIAESDPASVPSPLSAQVFAGWLDAAGPTSREPGHFADVAENYVPGDHTNRDLYDLFHMLETFIDLPEDDEDDEPAPRKTFIDLPLMASSGDNAPAE